MRELVEFFRCLGDPTRLQICKLLTLREFCVCELADLLGVTDSSISQHLRRLKALRLVEERRERQWVYYRADEERLEQLVAQFQRFAVSALEEIPEMRGVLARITASDPSAACTRASRKDQPMATRPLRTATPSR